MILIANCDDGQLFAGKTISIYEVAHLFGISYDSYAFTPRNIKKGFIATGIWPLNRNMFPDEDFLCSEVTNRPLEQSQELNSSIGCKNVSSKDVQLSTENIETPSPPESSVSAGKSLVLPEEILPHPKAAPRTGKCRSRAKKSAILTNFPVENSICKEIEDKLEKRKMTENRKAARELKKQKNEPAALNASEIQPKTEKTMKNIKKTNKKTPNECIKYCK